MEKVKKNMNKGVSFFSKTVALNFLYDKLYVDTDCRQVSYFVLILESTNRIPNNI